jgi:hypothetical protein
LDLRSWSGSNTFSSAKSWDPWFVANRRLGIQTHDIFTVQYTTALQEHHSFTGAHWILYMLISTNHLFSVQTPLQDMVCSQYSIPDAIYFCLCTVSMTVPKLSHRCSAEGLNFTGQKDTTSSQCRRKSGSQIWGFAAVLGRIQPGTIIIFMAVSKPFWSCLGGFAWHNALQFPIIMIDSL